MKLDKKLFGIASLIGGLACVLPACSSPSSDSETSETSSGSGENTGDTGDWSSDTSDGSSTEDTTTSSTDETTGSFVTDTGTDSTTDTGTGPQPNGSMCAGDEECESEICVMIPSLGGVCSECETDQNCMDSGGGLNCTIGASGYFACGEGAKGEQCMSDEACADELVCASVVDLGGLFNDQFCSDCSSDEMCADGELCTPDFDLSTFAGFRECKPAGSGQQDALCDDNAQCMSGFCGDADFMGFLTFGACGECLSDTDCADGLTCTPGSVDLGGGAITGPTCD